MIQRILDNLMLEKWLLFSVAIFFIFQVLLNKPYMHAKTDYITPPIELKYLNAGFSKQSSDSYWLRAVQDMDYCDQQISENICRGKSWLFNIINLTVELDKNFAEAYYYGALALTIIVNDFAGASVIFDKGVAVFNKEWPLLYAAAYHALFEEKDKKKASQLYYQAVENGAPDWVRLTAGRLASESGDNETARIILSQLIERESDPRWIEKLKKKIEQK